MKTKPQTVKFSTDNNTDIFFYYMPLNYSEKDKEDSASIVQTLGAPLYKMKRKSRVLHTLNLCVHEEKWCGCNQGGKISFTDTAAF